MNVVAVVLVVVGMLELAAPGLLLHWRGVVAEEQRAEDDRLRAREIDVSGGEQVFAFQMTRGNRYQAALLEETRSKDRRRSAREPIGGRRR